MGATGPGPLKPLNIQPYESICGSILPKAAPAPHEIETCPARTGGSNWIAQNDYRRRAPVAPSVARRVRHPGVPIARFVGRRERTVRVHGAPQPLPANACSARNVRTDSTPGKSRDDTD